MTESKKIENLDELEFAVFCIENVAAYLCAGPKAVYCALTQKSNILNGYIIPGYSVLHTQSRDYIVEDIIEVMREEGVMI